LFGSAALTTPARVRIGSAIDSVVLTACNASSAARVAGAVGAEDTGGAVAPREPAVGPDRRPL